MICFIDDDRAKSGESKRASEQTTRKSCRLVSCWHDDDQGEAKVSLRRGEKFELEVEREASKITRLLARTKLIFSLAHSLNFLLSLKLSRSRCHCKALNADRSSCTLPVSYIFLVGQFLVSDGQGNFSPYLHILASRSALLLATAASKSMRNPQLRPRPPPLLALLGL